MALIYAGFEQAIAAGAPRQACGLLVDEEFGAATARSARAAGYTLATGVGEQAAPAPGYIGFAIGRSLQTGW